MGVGRRMSMSSMYRRATLSLLLMVLMVGTSFAVLASAPANAGNVETDLSATSPGETASGGMVTVNNGLEKLDSVLAAKIMESRGPFKVYVIIGDRATANEQFASMGLPTVKGNVHQGVPDVRLLELDSKQIYSLSSNPGISKMMNYEKPVVDPIPNDAALDGVTPETIGPMLEDYDVDVVHGAVAAWADGWTGDGVKVAVIDDGFDMGHPDLQGQQARYDDGASPYYGWPIAYDDYAAALWSNDAIGGWVVDSSYSGSLYGDYIYFDGMRYKADDLKDVSGNPVTSMSGYYQIGYHPDQNLMSLWGSSVAVLVVDANVPWVYDTVYVDVTGDREFNNDKACTIGDEISYFDSYDPAVGVDDFSNWDAGDGIADYSGGMVYWISDGVNVLPGSAAVYGATYTPPSGYVVAMVGAFSQDQSHGTMTSSAALALGNTMGGQLGGMAPDAKLICIPFTGSIFGSWYFAEFGADDSPGGVDDPLVVSNSYGFSETTVDAGYELYDQFASILSLLGSTTLWFWSTGNGGPGYGTVHSIVDFSSVHVGAGTTMQYRVQLGIEKNLTLARWGDVAPFSNSGPSRTGKLNAEIIASGMYSMEPAPLNMGDYFGVIGDGSMHFQLGSGTSHATPTAAGAMALVYQAYIDNHGSVPYIDEAKAILMAAADDMHYDPFKQGAGWLNAKTGTDISTETNVVATIAYSYDSALGNEAVFTKSALYPGFVYGDRYETFPNFLLPGESDTTHVLLTRNLNTTSPKSVNITAKHLVRTGSELLNVTTTEPGSFYLDITSNVSASTQMLKVTMFWPLSVFDPDLNYETDVGYWLEAHNWADLDGDGVMNTTSDGWELFRYTVDGSDCNYNQITLKDPIKRTDDGLILRIRGQPGAAGVNLSIQLDFYEYAQFPWITLMADGGSIWTTGLDFNMFATGYEWWWANVAVPSDALVGTYEAGIYVDDGSRVQCIPVVINVAADSFEFDFGGSSYFDTPYNNDFTGIADKGWRFEVGDWRMYWSEPMMLAPDAEGQLVAGVSWTELPTDVNVHILASIPTTYVSGIPYAFEYPFGPDFLMMNIASSDEMYRGMGTFAVGTNTGGPKEVIASPMGMFQEIMWLELGLPGPFAVLTRCPVMAGNHSSDTLSGFTKWITMTEVSPPIIYIEAYEPGNIPLADKIEAYYDLTVTSPVDVKGGGDTPAVSQHWADQEVWQDSLAGSFQEALANAQYTKAIEVGPTDSLYVEIWGVSGTEDLDLGVWFDENRNGVAEMSEQYTYMGVGGPDEYVTWTNPDPGQYLVKVLGYTVTGTPGLFDLIVSQGVTDATIEATDLEPTADTGIHTFNVSYDLPARAGIYMGAASFGFFGADDMFSIPVFIYLYDVGKPVIENLLPAEGTAFNTNVPTISFDLNDTVEFYSGLDPGSVSIVVNGVDVSGGAVVHGNHVTLTSMNPVAEGTYTVVVQAADMYGNMADPVSTTFVVNTVIEHFDAQFTDPATGDLIPDGTTVSLTSVDMNGWSDPNAEVVVEVQYEFYALAADPSGYWALTGVNLTEGANSVRISTTNEADVSESMLKTIVRDTICMLVVDGTDTPVAKASVDISGLTEPGAMVTIGAVSAIVAADGRWTAQVGLAEGTNSMDVTAIDAVGNTKTVTITMVRDMTPPAVTIDSPADSTTVNVTSVTVSGTCELGAMVWVNGVLASSGGTSWSAVVALKVGANALTVTAMDALGNEATAQTRTVTYTPPPYAMQDDVDDVNARVDDADAFSSMLMYLSMILFVVAVILIGVVWYVLNRKIGAGGESSRSSPATEEVETLPSDVEREFEQLEKEIGKEDR
jgi:hypothetical protein